MRCPRAKARHLCSRAARASACRHYDRRARCSLQLDTALAACPPRSARVSTKHGPSCALGTMTPFGQSRGGTPEGVRALKQGRVPQPARLRRLRNSVLRRSASFLFPFFVARMERSEIRGDIEAFRSFPDCASLIRAMALPPLDRDTAGKTTAGVV